MGLSVHRMQLPREVVVGKNTLDQIGTICKRLDFSNSALIVMEPKTMEIAGRKAMDILTHEGLKVDNLVVTSCNIKAIVFVEAARVGMIRPLAAVVPFAKGPSGIASVCESIRDGFLIQVQSFLTCGYAPDTTAGMISTGKEFRPCG